MMIGDRIRAFLRKVRTALFLFDRVGEPGRGRVPLFGRRGFHGGDRIPRVGHRVPDHAAEGERPDQHRRDDGGGKRPPQEKSKADPKGEERGEGGFAERSEGDLPSAIFALCLHQVNSLVIGIFLSGILCLVCSYFCMRKGGKGF